MGVLGHAGVILEELGPDHPLQRHLEAIQVSAGRASDLTRQLMAYTGRGQFHHDLMDLGIEVREALQLLERSLPKHVALTLEIALDLPPVEGDHAQVQQVLSNLLQNAVEALGNQEGRVRISVRPDCLDPDQARARIPGLPLAPGSYGVIEVLDDGPGMAPEIQARIFEPFFTTKFQGRGLGLPAALGIVRGHRGGIGVESAPGGGTRVTVYLPAASRAPGGEPGPGSVDRP
jgi:signal transduction histidine kinase